MQPTNLTPERTSFVGRERELAALHGAFANGLRLVTILGPPGAGKTRIARKFGTERALQQRVWFVDLTAATTLDDLLDAIAGTLAVDSTGDADHRIEAIGRALEARGDVCLVLDNLEQIGESAAHVVSRLLDRAPATRFLTTSRDRLRVEGETCIDLSPLEDEHAVQLFVERARRHAVEDDELPIVRQVVQQLERLPLAIELAAGRMGVMRPRALLDRLSERQLWLGSTGREVTDRQRTLRGAVEWSWRILSEWERLALCQCAIFCGGFSIEAAGAVLDLSEIADAPGVEDALLALGDRSLVHMSAHAGEARFSLYAIIRELALEKLAEEGSLAEVEARHAAYFLRAGEAWAASSIGPHERENLERAFVDRHNLRAAHDAVIERDPRMAARLVLAMEPLALHRGTIASFVDLVSGLLARPAVDEDAAISARLLRARGESLRIRGRSDDALADLRRARTRAKVLTDPRLEADILRLASPLEHQNDGRAAETELGWAASVAAESHDDRLLAELLSRLGHICFERGEDERAREHYGRALEAARRTESPSLEAMVLCMQGSLAMTRHRFEDAREPLERALAIHRRNGDQRLRGVVLEHLAALHHESNDLDAATECNREALALHREVGDRLFEGPGLFSAGSIELSRGNLDSASRLFDRAIAASRDARDTRFEGFSLGWLGVVAVEHGDLASAREKLEESRRIALRIGDAHIEAHAGAWLAVLDAKQGRGAEARDAITALRARTLPLDDLVSIVHAFVDPSRNAERPRSAEGRIAARILGARPHASVRRLLVGPDGRWFQLGDAERVDLLRRRALRLMLARLVDARIARPGSPLTLDDLTSAGWPGERIRADAAAGRVYAAIRTLRRLGLEESLATSGDGYLLHPDIDVVRAS